MMKLGSYVNLMLKSSDLAASLQFYTALGFQQIAERVVTDGCININLDVKPPATPTLAYNGSDVPGVKKLFSKVKRGRGKLTGSAQFKSPEGLQIKISGFNSKLDMPAGTPTSRTPLSLCGMLGEFTLPSDKLNESLIFWAKLGFEVLHAAQIPYNYAILSDGLIVIGVHENKQPASVLTYFAKDMPERIKKIKAAGIDVQNMGEGDTIENGTLVTPEGQRLFLFTGDVFGGG